MTTVEESIAGMGVACHRKEEMRVEDSQGNASV